MTAVAGLGSSGSGQAATGASTAAAATGSAGLQIFFGILAGTIPVVIATNSNFPPLPAVVQTALHAATSAR